MDNLEDFYLSTLQDLGDNWYKARRFDTFTNGGNSIAYRKFELYLMGLISPDEVEDVILFSGLKATAKDFLDNDKWYAKEKISVTVKDVINKFGPIVPDYTVSQKEFRIFTLILTDDLLTEKEWAYFSNQAKGLKNTFSWATGNGTAATMGDQDDLVK